MSRHRARLAPALIVFVLAGCTGGVRAEPEATLSFGANRAPDVPIDLPQDRVVDHRSLAAAFDAAGLSLPSGTSIYGARVITGEQGLRYQEFDAGGGALDADFWPASTIKVLAAVGALEFLGRLGFTGAAEVDYEGQRFQVRDLYEESIGESSNEAYDLLLQVAGVDWLNTEFLSPERGFATTVIQRGYGGYDVRNSPPMILTEDDRVVELPPRQSQGEYGCPDDGNCSNLLELTDSIRRIVFADRIPAAERFAVSPADIAHLQAALLAADGFVEPGAQAVLGDGALVYNKPGEAPDEECVDVAVVEDQSHAEGYLLGVTTPSDDDDCALLTGVAALTLAFLRARPG